MGATTRTAKRSAGKKRARSQRARRNANTGQAQRAAPTGRASSGRSKPALPFPSQHDAARKAALPDFVAPQLATLVDAPPGGGYVHEIKLDGYRMLARVSRGRVRLLTRKGNDWSARLPSLVRALAKLPVQSALLDGEVVVLGPSGASDFQRLQGSLSEGRDGACLYYAFDLLHLEGYDLRALPLLARKELLQETLAAGSALSDRIRYSEHVSGDAALFLRKACELGLEGMVSKKSDAPYVSARTRAWLKLKCHAQQELVIGGFTEPEGARSHFGALLLGEHGPDGALRYVGKVGTGFSQQSLAELHQKLRRLEQPTPPFANPPRGAEARAVHWLRPELVAEVQFAERTSDGRVRHASFRGLREDKPAAEVTKERAAPLAPSERDQRAGSKREKPAQPAAAARVRLTHPDRVLYPEAGIRKRDLALYYAAIAPRMLPHVQRRPLMLVRCPEGHAAECFHQKHPSVSTPRAIHRVPIRERGKVLQSMYIDDLDGLLSLAQIGALEVHVWGSTVDDLGRPDQLVFDLDPDADLDWTRVIEAARELRARLQALGLTAFAKLTGGKGLHVVAPLVPRAEWDEAKAFCKQLVDGMVRDAPDRYLAKASKAERRGRIFLDYLRNGRGATAVCAYSTRARQGAPLAWPITWEALERSQGPVVMRLRDVLEQLDALDSQPDPLQQLEAARIALPSMPASASRARPKRSPTARSAVPRQPIG